jgi:16S rRNA C967 or C1407 C5-methylase (RsmB/RsmF family)
MARCLAHLALLVLTGAVRYQSHVIDACAAPGSKTSHLAAVMKNGGKIFAFDRSQPRLKNLGKLMALRGVTNVVPTHADFMEVRTSSLCTSHNARTALDLTVRCITCRWIRMMTRTVW